MKEEKEKTHGKKENKKAEGSQRSERGEHQEVDRGEGERERGEIGNRGEIQVIKKGEEGVRVPWFAGDCVARVRLFRACRCSR